MGYCYYIPLLVFSFFYSLKSIKYLQVKIENAYKSQFFLMIFVIQSRRN